jgi:hypothetical protein
MSIKESSILNHLVLFNGWICDGCYCKKEIYSDRLGGPDKPYIIGYIVINVSTLEISTELNDFYNPIYTKKEFDEKVKIELSTLNYMMTDVDPINKYIKQINNKEKQTITLKFELLKDGYRLISDISAINGITFSASDLTRINKAIETQEKLEYIFYRERNKIDLKEMVKKEKEND